MNRSGKRIGLLLAVVGVLGIAGVSSHFFVKSKLKDLVKKVEESYPGTHIKYGSYSIRPWSLKLILNDVTVTHDLNPMSYHVDRMIYGRCDFNHEVARHCDAEFEGFTFSMGQQPELQPMVARLEMLLGKPLRFDMKASHTYRPNRSHALDAEAELIQVGRLQATFKMGISGVDLDAITKQVKSMRAKMDAGDEAGAALAIGMLAMGELSNLKVSNLSFHFDSTPLLTEGIAQALDSQLQEIDDENVPGIEELKGRSGREKALALLRDSENENRWGSVLSNKTIREFILSPKSVTVLVKPPTSKTVGALFADQAAGTDKLQITKALGLKILLNGNSVELESLLPKDGKVLKTSL